VVRAVDAPPELADVPSPEPGPDEVLVQIDAASFNPTDLKIVSRAAAELLRQAGASYVFPVAIGIDGSGTVVRAGTEISRLKAGDRVVGQFRHFPLHSGTFAEYATAPETNALVRTPDDWDAVTAAAVPTAALTAKAALDDMALDRGDTLLILGATGGVGTFAVQLAHARGVRVIGTARAENAGLIRELGGFAAIDLRTRPISEELRRVGAGKVDGLLDLVSGSPESFAQHVEESRPEKIAVCADTEPSIEHVGSCVLRPIRLRPSPEVFAQLVKELCEQRIRVVIDQRVRLDDAVEALVHRGSRATRGKTVILVRTPAGTPRDTAVRPVIG
jgi:NADPH:quinone reductase